MKKIYFLFQFFFLTFLSSQVFADLQIAKFVMKNSENLLATPYLLNPLGEESGIDTDPLYRFDKFDCLTFVETVLAKSYADLKNNKDNNDVIFNIMMNKIRYSKGEISFETRNHFQNPDWLNNNAEYIENVSSDFAKKIGKSEVFSNIILDRQNWFKKNYNLVVPSIKENISLSYLPFDYFTKDFVHLIEEPYVFMTIIKDDTIKEKVGTEIDVSHTGFLINKNGKLYLRHASSLAGKVIDSDFFDYISKLQKKPKYLGFALLKIKDI